jgi:signal transduction histidine kinase
VNRARLRSIAISIGIVLLLGASVVMVVVTTSRARRLAKQQLEFVAGVSHELRTPVSVICSAAENLADGLVGDRQQAMKYGMVIQNEGRRLADMVEQVLELAGIQSQRRGYEFQPQIVSALISDALESLELQIVKGGFRVQTAIEPDLPPIKADAAAIRRAIQNLVANAMKYGGGEKWVGIKAEKSDDEVNHAGVRLTVEDRGIGIPPEELPYIFEAFFRGRSAVTDQIAGSGLGLSLVRNIIDAHAGRIIVHSVVGEGTAFILYLPAARRVESVSEEA